MTEERITALSTEATKGGFQAILKIGGKLEYVKRVAGKFVRDSDRAKGKTEPRDQAEIKLSGATVLAVEEGETVPELKNGEYIFWIPYAEKGKLKPHQNSPFVKGFQKSAESLWEKQGQKGKGWADFQGLNVIFERKEVILFKNDKDEEVKVTTWVFSEESKEDKIDEYILGLVLGKSKPVALRALATDGRAKQYPSYKDALQADNLESLLPVTVDADGNFQRIEGK